MCVSLPYSQKTDSEPIKHTNLARKTPKGKCIKAFTSHSKNSPAILTGGVQGAETQRYNGPILDRRIHYLSQKNKEEADYCVDLNLTHIYPLMSTGEAAGPLYYDTQ